VNEGRGYTSQPTKTIQRTIISEIENQILADVLKRAPRAIQDAALRLVRRAESDARNGNPRLLETLTELLKPRVHHLLIHTMSDTVAPNGKRK